VPLERPEDFNRLVTRFLTTPSAHVTRSDVANATFRASASRGP
jgi:hypothetical protein